MGLETAQTHLHPPSRHILEPSAYFYHILSDSVRATGRAQLARGDATGFRFRILPRTSGADLAVPPASCRWLPLNRPLKGAVTSRKKGPRRGSGGAAPGPKLGARVGLPMPPSRTPGSRAECRLPRRRATSVWRSAWRARCRSRARGGDQSQGGDQRLSGLLQRLRPSGPPGERADAPPYHLTPPFWPPGPEHGLSP